MAAGQGWIILSHRRLAVRTEEVAAAPGTGFLYALAVYGEVTTIPVAGLFLIEQRRYMACARLRYFASGLNLHQLSRDTTSVKVSESLDSCEYRVIVRLN